MPSVAWSRRLSALVVVVMVVVVACDAGPATRTVRATGNELHPQGDAGTPITVPEAIGALVSGPMPATGVAEVEARVVEAGFAMGPYEGTGTWLDVYDWSSAYTTSGVPVVGPDSVDVMAARGANTLFIQTARFDNPATVLEPELLTQFIDRAHANGMAVVGWYLPTYEHPAVDYERLMAIAELDVDGITVNIEATQVENIGLRSARAIELAALLRESLPGSIIGSVVFPPLLTETIGPGVWPAFPWAELAPYHDVWLTMGYWTDRRADSGWRDGYAYTDENLRLLRQLLDDPDLVVHPVGGLSGAVKAGQIAGMVRAATEHGAIGTSVYDYPSMTEEQWTELVTFGS